MEKYEAAGWTYLGTAPIDDFTWAPSWHKPALVFRRPAGKVVAAVTALDGVERLLLSRETPHADGSRGVVIGGLDTTDPAARQRRIELLEQELAKLKAVSRPALPRIEAQYSRKQLPLPPADMSDFMARLEVRRFGDNTLVFGVGEKDGGTLGLSGDKTRVEWADVVIRAMTVAMPPVAAAPPPK